MLFNCLLMLRLLIESISLLNFMLFFRRSYETQEKVPAAVVDVPVNKINYPVLARRAASETKLQEPWGGRRFGNSVRPHVYKLLRDKVTFKFHLGLLFVITKCRLFS